MAQGDAHCQDEFVVSSAASAIVEDVLSRFLIRRVQSPGSLFGDFANAANTAAISAIRDQSCSPFRGLKGRISTTKGTKNAKGVPGGGRNRESG